MKFKTISAADVAVLRKARKLLKKLKKRENKLSAIEVGDCIASKEWKTSALKHWRMLDELNALHIRVDELNGDMSLDAQ